MLLTHFSKFSGIWPAFYIAKSLGASPAASRSSTKPCLATSLDLFECGWPILWENFGCLPGEPWREEKDVCTWLPLLAWAHPQALGWEVDSTDPLCSAPTRGRRACVLLKTTGGKEPPWVMAVPTWTCWNTILHTQVATAGMEAGHLMESTSAVLCHPTALPG